MKCSNCGNDMVQSKAGWLCPECGHMETLTKADKAQAEAKLPEVLGRPAPAPAPSTSPEAKPDDTEETKTMPDTAADATEPKPEDAPQIENHDKAAAEATPEPLADEPTSEAVDSKPVVAEVSGGEAVEEVLQKSIAEIEDNPKPEPQTALSSSPAVAAALGDAAPEPQPADEPAAGESDPADIADPADPADSPVPVPEPKPEPPVPPTPSPAPAAAPTPPPAAVSEPVPVVADTPAPAPPRPAAPTTAAAAPLQPVTHPQPLSKGRTVALIVTFVVLLVIGGAAAYAIIAKPALPSWVPGAKASPTPTPAPKTSSADSSVLDATATPSSTAIPTPDPAAANAQRQADLAAYAAAYKATATGGFYAVTPPTVSVSATDPTTGQPYLITKDPVTAVGQIRYWPGGACSGPGVTPGATGTRKLALQTLLEGASAPLCLDVK